MVSLAFLTSLCGRIVADRTSLANMHGEQRAKRARRKRGSLGSRSYSCHVDKMLDIIQAKDKKHQTAKSGWLETGPSFIRESHIRQVSQCSMTGLYQEAQLDSLSDEKHNSAVALYSIVVGYCDRKGKIKFPNHTLPIANYAWLLRRPSSHMPVPLFVYACTFVYIRLLISTIYVYTYHPGLCLPPRCAPGI